MRRSAFRSALCVAAFAGASFLLAQAVHGQAPVRKPYESYAAVLPPGQARMVDGIKILNVRNNVYALYGAGGNITVLPFPEGVTLVDSGLEANADKVLAAIRTISTQPITYIINTNDLPDRMGGNQKLARTGRQITGGNVVGSDANVASIAEVIGHENVLNRLSARQPPISSDFIPATSYYTPTLKLSTAYHGDAIQLFHEPAAQTDGDSIVWFRHNDIIATGGIFSTTNYPKIDLARGGTIDGEIDALNHIIDIAFPEFRVEGGTLMVPSSGRLGDMADVAYYRDMVTIIRDRVKDMLVNKKMTLEQVKAQKPTRDYDGYYVADAAQYSPDQFVEVVYTSLAAAIAKNAPPATAKPAPARKN